MDLSIYNKILIVRLSSLGDILLTTPLIRSIKLEYPNIKLDFLVRQEYEDTIKYNPHLRNIITLNREYDKKKIANLVIGNDYDLIIDLQNNFRSKSIIKYSKAKIVRYKKPYLKRFLLVNFKINRFDDIIPIPKRYADSIPSFNLDEKGLELFLPKEISPQIADFEKIVAICPGSQHYTKMWPEEFFVKLGNKLSELGYKIILLGGKSDIELCKRLEHQIKDSISFANNNNLVQIAANMKQCNFIISNDSGMMHTALAINKPVIAIFGSTVKEFGFFPYKGTNLVIENNNLSCRPCSHIGLKRCPKKHFKCMKELNPEMVFEKIIKFSEHL